MPPATNASPVSPAPEHRSAQENDDDLVITCPCGRAYTRATWTKLPLVGFMPDNDGVVLELRNCCCGSTRTIAVPAPPPAPPGRAFGVAS